MILIKTSMKGYSALQYLLGLVFFVTHLSSCMIGGSNTAKKVISTCNVPSDQSGTISGHWLTTPIPLAFHEGDFNSSEINAIVAAVNTWNTFFQDSKQKTQELSVTTNGNINMSTQSNPNTQGSLCSQSILTGNTFTGSVVIYKLTSWPSSYPGAAIALTSFCTTKQSNYPSMYMAIMEINYQNFFTRNQFPDLQSITLHELGHVLGLDHTCSSSGAAGFPNCRDPNLNPSYTAASMYPTFYFSADGSGQVKQDLGTNDESRVNCLY